MLTPVTRPVLLPVAMAAFCALCPSMFGGGGSDEPLQVIQPARPASTKLVAVDRRIATRVNQLRPCVKARLKRVVEKLPANVTILVTSAHRTREEQASLVPTFGIKARPGRSTHEDGRAVDVNVLVDGVRISPRRNQRVIGAAMASEGFRYLGRRDPVHYSIPKEKIDPAPTEDPVLEVATWDEMQQQTVAAAPAPQPVTPAVSFASASQTATP